MTEDCEPDPDGPCDYPELRSPIVGELLRVQPPGSYL